jgi:hypothetical protein
MANAAAVAAPPWARLFLVETSQAQDALLRVLSVFAVQQVALASVAFAGGPDGGSIRIEARRLSEAQAEHLSARLRSVPAVRGVSLGWRSAPPG